ncbi:helix-turn-helix transcriptional regulator [Caloranaerobacter ferrireducens]|uniref:helix-turn-helix transcriptional regulator n=1 Tax=Caloranaerobacter ferrireducens TaxID=1323370 RepID=UPI00084D082C|nr:helix-turn-helix transcriptional regulator [Caloranaerobacter ferrireducens]
MNFRYLKSLRVLEGFTQEQIAQLLNISVQSYNKKENGKVPFTANELKTLADFFGVAMENFFKDNVVIKTTQQSTA